MKKFLSLFSMLILSLITNAQVGDVEMADELRANGKIYVVVSVLAVILLLMFVYLYLIDRKVSRLENGREKR